MKNSKPFRKPPSLLTGLALLALAAGSGQAQTTYIRQNNTTLLNVAGAWSPAGGPPTSVDTAKWDNTDSGNLSTALGGSVTWGQILFSNNVANAITIGNTLGANLTLNGINGIGIDMTMANRNLTINDPVILGNSQTWSVGSGVLAVGYPISEASAGLALTKVGLYQLTLNPATPNTFTGGLTINGGTVLADFSNMGTTTDLINNGNALTLGGGTLIVQGKASSMTAQTFNGLNVNQGYSYLTNNLNSATSVTTTLGGITRNTGGTLSFGSTGTFNTSQGNVNGILGPWAFVGLAGSTKYAVGGGNIAGLTGTSASTAAGVTDTTGTANYDVAAGGTLGAGANFNTLRYTGASGTIAGPFTANGLMNAAASAALTLNGAVTIGSSQELVVNPAGTGGITLSGVIGDNGGGASALTLGGGTATVTLSGANTFSGPVTVGAGTLAINNIANGGSPSALGQSSASASNLLLGNGATLAYNGTAVGTSDRSFTLNGSATLNVSSTGALNLTNTNAIAFGVPDQSLTITFGGTGGSLASPITNIFAAQITDNGAGQVQIARSGGNPSYTHWWLTNPNNNFSGGIRFNRGFLIFSSGALGTRGTIGFDANTAPPFGLRWAPGNSDDISSRFTGATSANQGYGTLDVGTNDVVFAYGIAPGKDPSWIIKDGTGSLTMNGSNVWGTASGATTVNAGTLAVKFLNNGGTKDGIGGVKSAAQWFGLRDGATFKYVGNGSTTDHNFHFDGNAAIDASGTGPLVFAQTGPISPTPAARAYTMTANSLVTGNAPSIPSDLPIGMTVGGTGVAPGSKIVAIGLNGVLTLDTKSTGAVTNLTFGSYAAGTLTLTGTNTDANEIKGSLQDSVSGIDSSVAVRSLAKTGTGKWILSGANTYSGTTTIGGGTLALGANSTLPSGTAVTLAGGTLDAQTFSNSVSTLDVTGSGTINFGSGGTLAFADSSANAWSGGTLNITGTFVSGSSLRFGTTSSGLTGSQLAQISYPGHPVLSLDANGYLVAPSYTVTFDSNGGSSVPSQVVAAGTTATQPADPTKLGYNFAGWYADPGLTTPFDFGTAINADTTVYASWTASSSPQITTSVSTLPALSTTYGTASSATSFTVSGQNMTTGATVTPPVGFEVSTASNFSSNVGNHASPITVGSAGAFGPITVYIRLVQNAAPASYDSQNVALSSSGATTVNVTTAASGNTVSAKQLTVTGLSAASKVYDGTTAATVSGTASLQPAEAFGSGSASDGKPYTGDSVSLSGTSTSGTFASAGPGVNLTVSFSGLSLTGTAAVNYSLKTDTLSATINGDPLNWVAGDGTWDFTTPGVWQDSAANSVLFLNGNKVVLDDSATSSPTITLNTTVAPAGVSTTNSARDYIITGTGSIAGTGSVTKNGTGTLTLATANAYTGGSTVSAGTLAGVGANAFGSSSNLTLGAATATLSLRGDTSTSFVKASDSTPYPVRTTTGGGATINVDQATVAGTSPKTMTLGPLTTTSTAQAWVMNFTGAHSTSLSLGAVTGAARASGQGTNTYSNSIASPGTLTLASYTGAAASGGAGEAVNFAGAGDTMVTGAISPGPATLSLNKSGTGTLTLNGSSTYTGGTTVSGGTLILGAGGSIANSSQVAIGAGGTFDVSAKTSPYTLSGSTNLSASGTGTTVGTTEAQLIGPAAGAVDLGSQRVTLTWGGSTTGTDTTHPCLVVSQGALTLNNNPFTINGATLGVGTYSLVSVTGGTITGAPNATPTGTAIDGTKQNVLSVSGGTVILTVTAIAPSGPAYLTNQVVGSTLQLSWPAGQGWRLQVQTNSLPVGLSTNWVYLTDGSVSSTNIPVLTTQPTAFYRLAYP